MVCRSLSSVFVISEMCIPVYRYSMDDKRGCWGDEGGQHSEVGEDRAFWDGGRMLIFEDIRTDLNVRAMRGTRRWTSWVS